MFCYLAEHSLDTYRVFCVEAGELLSGGCDVDFWEFELRSDFVDCIDEAVAIASSCTHRCVGVLAYCFHLVLL